MHKPRDHHIADRVGGVRLARLFSNIASPPVMFAVMALALSLYELPFWPGLAWAAVYGFFVSLAPILFVLYLLKSGRIVELHMTNTSERHLPYFVAVLGSFAALGLILLFEGPDLLRGLALFNIITLGMVALINIFWLVSFHTTAASALVAVTALVFGGLAALLVLPLLVLVITARLYLQRHTVAQTVGGLLLGTFAVWLVSLFGFFN